MSEPSSKRERTSRVFTVTDVEVTLGSRVFTDTNVKVTLDYVEQQVSAMNDEYDKLQTLRAETWRLFKKHFGDIPVRFHKP